MNNLRSSLRTIKKTEFVWRYLSNLSPTLNYSIGEDKRLTGIEREVVDKLDREGIAVVSVDSLLQNTSGFAELEQSMKRLLEQKKAEIAELKLNAECDTSIGSKAFNMEVLGGELIFDAKDPFARFALSDALLNIANAYFRMFAKLRYYNVWYTAASNRKARESQLWHFDREDNYILKVFLYLEDVDHGSGPFTYAPGTHKKGKYRSIEPEYFLEGVVRRTTDEQMRAVFPEDRWITGVGTKGTLIFADTRGFHKGGEARSKDRLMYTCMYTSPASESKKLIQFPSNFDSGLLSPKQLQALNF